MSIEQHIVNARRQFTGEGLKEARQRLRDLKDWSAPVPAATGYQDQARLESHRVRCFLSDGAAS
jgi:hypothetical protein